MKALDRKVDLEINNTPIDPKIFVFNNQRSIYNMRIWVMQPCTELNGLNPASHTSPI